MSKLKKISLIIIVSIISLVLLIVFVLINFPYNSIIKRIDFYLARKYSSNLAVLNIRYRFPTKLFMDDVRFSREDGVLEVRIDRVIINLKLLNFSRAKRVEILGTGLDIKSEYLELSKGKFTLVSGLLLPYIRGEMRPEALRFLRLRTEALRIERIYVSGFEFTSIKVPIIDIALKNEGEKFVVERGTVKSDLFSSEISGGFNFEMIDGKISLTPSNEFYRKYSNLKSIIDSVSHSGVLTVTIKGSIQRPTVRFVKS